jgi:gliding motility-associated-like protein
VFRIRGVFIDTYHIEIYDRWGRLVFESDDIENSWDGTIDGKPAPADVYTYLVEAGGRKKQKEAVKGTVTLIR